jgi:hypothetical protein
LLLVVGCWLFDEDVTFDYKISQEYKQQTTNNTKSPDLQAGDE